MRQHRNPVEQTLMRRRLRDVLDITTFPSSREHFTSKPLNRWRKRHPLDCGRPKCGLCHCGRKGRPFPDRNTAIAEQVLA